MYIIDCCYVLSLLLMMCSRTNGSSSADGEVSCVCRAVDGSDQWDEPSVERDDIGWSQQSVLEVQQATRALLWTAIAERRFTH